MSVRFKGLWALAVTVALIGAGCGFGLSGPDPQRPRNEPPKCDTSKGMVAVDGVMATVASIFALALVASSEPAAALIPGGIAVAYIGGAVHGSRAVDECRAAQDQWSTEMAARDTLSHTSRPPGDDEEEEAPRPKKAPVAPPEITAIQPPIPVAPQPPVVEQPPSPEQVPVQSPPQEKPKQKAPPSKQKAPPPPSNDDEWGEFWREVQ